MRELKASMREFMRPSMASMRELRRCSMAPMRASRRQRKAEQRNAGSDDGKDDLGGVAHGRSLARLGVWSIYWDLPEALGGGVAGNRARGFAVGSSEQGLSSKAPLGVA